MLKSEEILVFSLMASDYTLWYLQEKLKDTKGIIRSRSRKLKKKDNTLAKRTNNDLQNTTQNTKY
jgi:hypothetical protein